MKTNLIRAVVFTLVFAGFSASGIASYSRAGKNSIVMAKGGPGTVPTPACGPHDPTHCGADDDN